MTFTAIRKSRTKCVCVCVFVMERVDYFIIRHIVSGLYADKRDKHGGVNGEGARCRGVVSRKERKGKT